jgi:hypothetical protein
LAAPDAPLGLQHFEGSADSTAADAQHFRKGALGRQLAVGVETVGPQESPQPLQRIIRIALRLIHRHSLKWSVPIFYWFSANQIAPTVKRFFVQMEICPFFAQFPLLPIRENSRSRRQGGAAIDNVIPKM